MRPKSVILTLLLAGILTSSAIHLGRLWVRADAPLHPHVRQYAGGPEWLNR